MINGIFDFIIGGITGVMQSMLVVNIQVHGTYWVTGHFHFIFMGITTGIIFAAVYMLWPTITRGRKYDQRLATWHMALTAIGSFVMSMGWTIGGFLGMPRYVSGYFARFQVYQDIAIAGGVIIGIGQLFFLANLIKSTLDEPSTTTNNAFEDTYNDEEPSLDQEPEPLGNPSAIGGE